MHAFLALLAFGSQEPLYPCPRIMMSDFVRGTADFNLDGLDDVFSRDEAILSDGSFGGIRLLLPVGSSNGDPAVADLNGDGYPDLVVPDDQTDKIYVQLFRPLLESFLLSSSWGHTNPWTLACGDVNGDGDVDVLASGEFTDDYKVYLGDGAGGKTATVSGDFGVSIVDVLLGDLNADGLDDYVAISKESDLSRLVVGLAAGGGAFAAPALGPLGSLLADVEAADLDADGDLDLATVSHSELVLHAGDGAGGFAPSASLAFEGEEPSGFVQLRIVDYDSSGTLDVVSGDSGKTALLVAYGDGSGGIAGTEELELLNEPSGTFEVCDPDGDGDLDVGAFFWAYSPTLTFFEREGALVTPVLLSELRAVPLFDSVIAGDADADGDDDVLIVSGAMDGPTTGAVVTIGRNDGAGAFTFEPGPPVPFSTTHLALHDIAGDGTVDLLADHLLSGSAFVYPADGVGGFGPAIPFPFEGTGEHTEIADYSNDGLADLLACSSGGLRYYPGQATYSFGDPSLFVLSTISPIYRDVAAADLDLDGDLDAAALLLFSFSDTHLRLVAGDGAGGLAQYKSINLGGAPTGPWPAGLDTGDFNVDGFPDVVLSDTRWYRGIGAGQVVYGGQPLALPEDVERDIHTGDVDGDGDDDAVRDDALVLQGGPSGLQLDRGYYDPKACGVALGHLTGSGPLDLVVQIEGDGYYLLASELGCPGFFATYGAGCPGSGGVVPALAGAGCPTPGGSYTLEVSGGLPSTVAYASFGLGQGSIPLPNGCKLLLNPWIPVFVGFTLNATGEGSLPIAVSPSSPVGVTFTTQVGLFDPAAPGYFTLTNGLAVTVR